MARTRGHTNPPENYRASERASDKGRRRSTHAALHALTQDPDAFEDDAAIANPRRRPFC